MKFYGVKNLPPHHDPESLVRTHDVEPVEGSALTVRTDADPVPWPPDMSGWATMTVGDLAAQFGPAAVRAFIALSWAQGSAGMRPLTSDEIRVTLEPYRADIIAWIKGKQP